MRKRLEAHRKNSACAGCHAKIDPLGLALENFNAIGAWRDKEGFGYHGAVVENDPDIDASGKLPDGREFRGVHQLQSILLEDNEKFLRCLCEKMFVFALGRGIHVADRETIDFLVRRMPQHDYQLRQLIKDIVLSEPFQSNPSKRNQR